MGDSCICVRYLKMALADCTTVEQVGSILRSSNYKQTVFDSIFTQRHNASRKCGKTVAIRKDVHDVVYPSTLTNAGHHNITRIGDPSLPRTKRQTYPRRTTPQPRQVQRQGTIRTLAERQTHSHEATRKVRQDQNKETGRALAKRQTYPHRLTRQLR